MPIYEYVCRNCGHELERLQRISEEPLTQCPACDTAELKRKISAAGFRLSGGGWYETDFKSDGKRNIAARDDSTSKASNASDTKSESAGEGAKSQASGSSSDSKSDTASKPAKKTESKPASKSADTSQ
jgi:putative FmdB family regulatory protein